MITLMIKSLVKSLVTVVSPSCIMMLMMLMMIMMMMGPGTVEIYELRINKHTLIMVNANVVIDTLVDDDTLEKYRSCEVLRND